MQIVIAIVALLVAVQYGFIGLYIVPRLARLADERGTVIRAAQWGAAVFFLGCGLTHVGVAIHALGGELVGSPGHLLLAHVWPHLAQVFGGATFSYIAWRKIDVRFGHKGWEEERLRAAALLAQRAAQQQAVARLGQRALDTPEPGRLIDEAVRLVAETLDADFAEVLELEPSGQELRIVAGVGWSDGVVGGATVPAEGSQAGFTLQHDEPVVVEDLRRERRFAGHSVLHDHEIVSGMTVVIRSRSGPFGVVGVHTRAHRSFSADNINFLKSVANVLGTALDRAAAEDELRQQALQDTLTGLPNRALFLDRLRHALERGRRCGSQVAVLLLDVDQFKVINDSLARQPGDEHLVALAPRLRDALRAGDTVARLGGDEFVVLTEHVDGERDAVALAERLADAWAQPLRLASGEFSVTASIGIALSGAGAESSSALLRQADAAMYRAKGRGRGRHELFDEQMRAGSLQRLRLETDLRGALEGGELQVVYQPIFDLATTSPVAVEALLRWEHPERGTISPAEFIPAAEDTGLIVPIGRWVLEQACAQAARWQQAAPGGRPLVMSVNLSARQIARPELALEVASLLAESGVAPGTLALEITESVLMRDADAPLQMLQALKATGARLLLDDFGTGDSSLSYLKRFPLDGVKIDRSFVAGLGDDEADPAIVAAVVSIAGRLGLSVVAEGVETSRQLSALRELGCEHGQGYYFARPLPAPELDDLLTRAPAAAAT